jgi:two-component system, NarL family, nitrate/nitrite response regulator NarL
MKVLIADDHTLFRRGLRLLLSSLYDDIDAVEAADADGALRIANEQADLDLVLCDLAMPGMEQLKGLQALAQRLPKAPIVILSAISNPDDIVRTIESGARGYILKSASDETLKHALSLVLAGETYIPSDAFLDRQRRWVGSAGNPPLRLSSDNPLSTLTPRQRDVLTLLMGGQSNKEIARNLGLLESTVKAHVKIILSKLNVANRTQAAMVAADLGWPQPEFTDKSPV